MGEPLRSAAVSSASHLVLFIAAMTISIFGFHQYEAAWGPGHTWQVLFWLAVGSGVLVFVGALFGSILASRAGKSLPPLRAIAAGALTASLLISLLYLKRELGMEGGLFGAVIGSMLIPFAAQVAFGRER